MSEGFGTPQILRDSTAQSEDSRFWAENRRGNRRDAGEGDFLKLWTRLIQRVAAEERVPELLRDALSTASGIGERFTAAHYATEAATSLIMHSLLPAERASRLIGLLTTRRSEYLMRRLMFARLLKIANNPVLALKGDFNDEVTDLMAFEREFAYTVAELWLRLHVVEPPADLLQVVLAKSMGSAIRIDGLSWGTAVNAENTNLLSNAGLQANTVIEQHHTVALPYAAVRQHVADNSIAILQ